MTMLTHQNQKGGKKVTGFPIREENGMLGYFLGYCDGCNEPILMSMRDREILIATFHCEDKTIIQIKNLISPKTSLTDNFLRWLGEWITRQVHNRHLTDAI